MLAARRAHDLGALLQLPPAEELNLATAVWELARRATPRGNIELAVDDEDSPQAIIIAVAGVPHSDLDLDALRHLVSRIDSRDIDGAALVQLTAMVDTAALVDTDMRIPPDGLNLVLASLARYDTEPRSFLWSDELPPFLR